MVKPEPVFKAWPRKKGISPYVDEMPNVIEQL
jgi:hypothetical protein